MDPDFRLVNVQGWITHNEEVLRDPAVGGLDRETFAHELASEHPTHPLWRHCARVTLREITQACRGFEQRELGIGARPRPIGPDLELVRMFPLEEMDQDETGQHYFASGASVVVLSILCRRRETQWLVAGLGAFLGHPGWPPRFEQVVQPDD